MNTSRTRIDDECGTWGNDDIVGDPLTVFLSSTGWAAAQTQGTREEQQDCFGWLVEPDLDAADEFEMLLVVADGMGGHSAGARASSVAATTFIGAFASASGTVSERLEDAIHQANHEVGDKAIREGTPDMGTTLVVAHVAGGRLRWLSVGDSPMWLVRRTSDTGSSMPPRLVRLNQDHSMKPILRQLVESGDLTEDEVANDGRRHELRSAVVGDEIRLMDFREDPVELAAGDILLLATDGLETLADDEIARLATADSGSPDTIVERLLLAVRDRAKPSQDNTTVMVYSPSAPASEQSGAPLGRRRWLVRITVAALYALLLVALLVERARAPDDPESGARATPPVEQDEAQ